MSVPGPPNIVQLPFASPNTLEFKWGPPLDPGGDILGYKLTINGTEFLINSNERYYSVTGLINGQTYFTSLEALNANGWGPKANFINFQPGSEPTEGPATFTVIPNGSNASLSWTPPATLPDAPIQWYGLYAQDSYFNYNYSYSANGFTQSNYYIQNLSSMAYYYDYSNYAVNCPGWSPVVSSPAQRKRGTPEWVTYIGGPLGQNNTNQSIATDKNNNVYIVGEYISTTNIYNYSSAPINGGNVRTTLYGTLANQDATLNDTFFIKYNSGGTVEWVSKIGSLNSQNVPVIATDISNNVYISGTNTASYIQFYNPNSVSANSTILVTVAGNMSTISATNDIYLAKYNSSGIFQWATVIGSTATENNPSIYTDPLGNVYIGGDYNGITGVTTIRNAGTPDINLNIATTTYGTMTKTGTNSSNDSFLVKYNSSGTAQWATRLGGTGNEVSVSVTCDTSENVYIMNSYNNAALGVFNSATPSGGVITPTLFGNLPFTGISVSQADIAIVKYTSTGTVSWVTRLSSTTNTDFPEYIITDSLGNLYVSGRYNSLTGFTFHQGSSNVISNIIQLITYGTLPNTGAISTSDMFLIKYNSNGAGQWVTRIGSSTGIEQNSVLAVDPSNNIYIAGTTGTSPIIVYNKNTPSANSTINVVFYGNLSNTASGTAQDIFFVKYDSDGNAQWATMIGGSGTDTVPSLSADSLGNVYMSGYYNSTSLIINNPSLAPTINNSTIGVSLYGTLPNDGLNDQFLIKFQT